MSNVLAEEETISFSCKYKPTGVENLNYLNLLQNLQIFQLNI